MKFDYLVKHNGVYYQAGEDVPIEGDSLMGASVNADTKTENKVVEPKSDEVVEVEKKVEDAKKYTKTEINRMSTKELRELANANGINGDDHVGSELKSMLIEKLV